MDMVFSQGSDNTRNLQPVPLPLPIGPRKNNLLKPRNSAEVPDWNKHTAPTTASEPRKKAFTSVAFEVPCDSTIAPLDRDNAANVSLQQKQRKSSA